MTDITGTPGDDLCVGTSGDDQISGLEGNDTLEGADGSDTVDGGAGDDLVRGNAGDDTVSGGDGHDFVRGDGGNDQVSGDAGDDYVAGSGGTDYVDGGSGYDRTGYFHTNAALGGANVSLLLQGQWQNTGAGGNDFLISIEAVSGTPFADTLIGDDAGNWLWGSGSFYDAGAGTIQSTTNNDVISAGGGDDLVQVGVGNHTLDGGSGSDWLGYFENAPDMVGATISLALQGQAQETGVGTWTVSGFENLDGSNADDHLTGDDNANIIGGGGGNDTLVGGAGDDRLLGDGGAHLQTEGYAGPVTHMDDYGNVAGNDTLQGGAGNDTLIGGGGNDLLDGGEGGDYMVGGVGDDVYVIDQAGSESQWGDGVHENANEGTDEVRTSLDWGLMDNVENLTATGSGNTYLGGNALNNVLTGNLGNNFMRGDGGNDSLNGGAGHDTAGFALPGGTAGTLRVVQGDNGTLLVQLVHEDGSFEDVFVVTPTGNGSATVTGVGLMAGQGTDTVSNVENLDFFIDNWPTPREPGESVGVPLSIYVPQSPDFLHVSGSVGSDSINLGAIYPDVTVGTPVNASGGFGDDTIIGTAGDNYLVGEAGSDVINGAGGWDTAAFHLPRGTTGTLRFVEDEDGQVRVELVQADGTFETVFEVTFTGDGTATVTGVGMVAALGTDTVTVENLHFSVESWPAQPAEGQSIGMSIASYAPPVDENGFAHVSGSPAGDTIDLAALYPDADAENNINASGGGGNDTILGTAGQNHISGGFGNDTLQGLAGNDFLHGDEGNDTIQGGADNDWMSGGVGDDSLDGGAGTNDIAGFMLPEGMVGDLRVVNGTGANAGMLVVQRVNGGTVEDLFLVSVDQSGTATVTGINSAAHLGTDTISGVEQLHFFPQNAPPGVQFTSIAIRVGGPGDEQINGFGNADIMLGGTGNDTLRGFAGDDAIRGGEGNDIVIGGGGNDYLDGGAGYDRAAYGGASNGVTVDLNLQGQAQNTGQGMDILVGIENVNGSNFNDVLVGDGGDNWLLGLAGNDTISGGAGNDLIDVGAGDHMLDGGAGNDTLVTFSGASLVGAVNISLALQGAAQNTGQGSMILTGIENLSGSNFNDALTGDEGNNIVGGDHGDDTLAGGAGNDQLYGDGFAYFSGDAPGATWIEDGSAFGAVGNDTLQGGAGNDTLIGGGGNDLLDGGEGSDTAIFLLPTETAGTYSLVPGQGLDAGKTLVVLTYNGMSSVVAQITSAGGVITVTGVDLGESLGADTLTDVETITFGTQGQSSGAVSLQLASGVVADGLVAGATVFMDANGDGKWQPGEATTTTAEDGTFMFLTNGSGPLVVVGGINTDTGLPNLVTLSAPAGSTVVNPLTTLVQAILDSPSSDPDLTPQGAAEMVAASLGISANIDLLNTDVFSAAAAGDTQALQAQAAAAIIVSILVTATDAGGATAGTQVLENLAEMVVEDRQSPEAAGVDLTQAAAIEDALAGALAPDQIAQVTPGLVEAAGEISAADSLAEMSEAQAEALTTGNDLDNVLTGGSMNDELFGFGGNDRLSGNGGDDRLAGGAGDDLLDGGAGNDTATYDGAAAGVTVSLAIAGAQNTIGAGLDTLLNLENLIGSGFDDHLTGNSGDNRLEGNAGNDVLSGAAGNDLLIGGIGADRLDGGLGNDTADYSNSAAAVSINLVAGKHAGGDATGDTLSSIENVTGSAFDDRLVGDQNGNVLIGGAGNDVINGGGGMDVLWGGAGSDLFVFKTAAEAGSGASGDKIMDFEAGGVGLSLATDRIDLSAIDAIAGSKKDDSFTFIGDRGFTGKAGELQVLTQNGVATVSGDVNGDGKADFSFTVQYTGSLDASDFLF